MYKEAPGAHSSGGFVISRTKVAVLIDGGHVRALARAAKKIFNPDYIERVAVACIASDETAFRFLYYDCAPYEGTVKKPVSATPHVFQASDQWLQDLAAKDLFAVRRGVLKFRVRGRPMRILNRTLSRRAWICGSASTWLLSRIPAPSTGLSFCQGIRTAYPP